MKNILIFLFICFGFALNSQITITCYECKKNTTVDCKGCNIQSNLFTGIVIKEKGKPDIPLYEPYKVSNKSSVFTFEDAFGTKTIVNVTSVLSYNTPKKLYDYLSNCLCKPSTIDTDTDRYSVLIQDSILVTYDINGVEIDRDTIRLFDIDTDTKTFLVQDSILVYYDESNTEIDRDTIDIPNITEQGNFRISNDTLYHNNSIDGIEQFVKLPTLDTTTQSYLPILNGLDTIGYENIMYLGGVEVDRDTIDYQLWYEKRICLNTATPSFTPSNLLMPTYAEVQAWVTANLTLKQQLNGTHVVYYISGQGGDCDNPDYTWVLNQGSELVTRTQNSILTLPNYTALRNLTKYNHDVVIVQDWTYTGPDGNTYTTLGGVFKRLHNVTSVENGGTLIKGVDGTQWERDWDGIHVQPEWWECGGYSFNGVNYTSKNTSADGIYNDRDRINSAAQVGSVIELIEGSIYEIDITIGLNNHILNMNRATLKRYAFTNSVLTANFASGNTSLTVSDPTPYRVGQRIAVMDDSGAYGGILTDNTHVNDAGVTNTLTITSIAGNVINVSVTGSVNNTYVAGDKVVILCTMLDAGNSGIQVYNGFIDGNRDDYPIEWWNSQYIITGSSFENEDMFVVKNLYIKDNTGECIGIPTGIIENIILENSTGSMIHIGAPGLTGLTELGGKILNCVAKNVCQSNVMTSAGGVYKNHNEGVITFSLNSKNWVIDGLRVYTSGTGVLGSLDDNDDNISLLNSYAYDCQFVIPNVGGSNPSDDGLVSNIRLINNIFIDCGMLYAVSSGQTIVNLIIKDNKFINTMFVFSNLNGFEFINNYVEDNGTFTWDYTNIYGLMNSSIGIRSYFYIGANNQINNVKISGNTFIGRKIGDTAVYTNGIFIPLVSAVNNTTDQGFFTLHKNIEISNNSIQYFPRGISFSQSYVVVVYKEYQNIKINNNVVKMNSTVIANQYAVMVLPGMECYDNVLIGQQGGRQGADTYVAHVLGLFNGSLNIATNRGAQFYNNKVIGSNVTPVTVGQNACDNNCLVYNNVTNAAIQDLTLGLSTFFNNTVSTNTNILD